ncbi:MAG TPA: hypothetical protein VEJ39_02685 [Candidatus Acidoferrales bacterium]|nr:hypothetical protein [Candidatus Acidoferrales bacterium]
MKRASTGKLATSSKEVSIRSGSRNRRVAVYAKRRADSGTESGSSDLSGRGLLVPALATGIEYPVAFALKSAPAGPQYGRVQKPTRWAKCSIRTAQKRAFPDGHYFLHTPDGRVHQLKVIGGVWHCLALAA